MYCTSTYPRVLFLFICCMAIIPCISYLSSVLYIQVQTWHSLMRRIYSYALIHATMRHTPSSPFIYQPTLPRTPGRSSTCTVHMNTYHSHRLKLLPTCLIRWVAWVKGVVYSCPPILINWSPQPFAAMWLFSGIHQRALYQYQPQVQHFWWALVYCAHKRWGKKLASRLEEGKEEAYVVLSQDLQKQKDQTIENMGNERSLCYNIYKFLNNKWTGWSIR